MRFRDCLPGWVKNVYWKARECVEPRYKSILYSLRFLLFRIMNKSKNFELDRRTVPIYTINPFDALHRDIDSEHRKGIDVVKVQILQGRKICPVLVCNYSNNQFPNHCGQAFEEKRGEEGDFQFQRLDGFKRFMAFKELGHEKIEVIVDNDSFPGGQHRMSWLEKSKSRTAMEYSFIKSIGNQVFTLR